MMGTAEYPYLFHLLFIVDGKEVKAKEQPRFVQSKWETVDPEDVEAQAMTTSKWDQLETGNVDGQPLEAGVEEETVEEVEVLEEEEQQEKVGFLFCYC